MTHTKAQEQFRRRLTSQIKRVDIKRTTLAKLAGVSVGQLNRWTDGDLMPTYQQFQRLLEIFGIEDEYLLGNSISEHAYNRQFK